MTKARTPGLRTSRKALEGFDGRTRLAKSFRAVKKELTTALGGDPSPQESVLIDRAVFLLFRVQIYEAKILAGGPESEAVSSYYLSWVGALRRILESLGLQRRAREMTFAELAENGGDHAGQ